MSKTYRKLQHWERWLQHAVGKRILAAEKLTLASLLAELYGKQALMIGTAKHYELLQLAHFSCQTILTPFVAHIEDDHIKTIESELYELPIATGSLDLVILPHTLEFIDHPRHLLTEACRIVKPEGHIVIIGFNPFSFWGLKKLLMKSKHVPWSGHYTSAHMIRSWLALADFQIRETKSLLYPTVFKQKSTLSWFERFCQRFHLPGNGIHIIVAQAKVIPLTPIKMRWKQTQYDLSLPEVTMPKPTIRTPTT